MSKYIMTLDEGTTSARTIIYDKKGNMISVAQKERLEGKSILVVRMAKNKKFQKQQLSEQGYEDIREFYENPLN